MSNADISFSKLQPLVVPSPDANLCSWSSQAMHVHGAALHPNIAYPFQSAISHVTGSPMVVEENKECTQDFREIEKMCSSSLGNISETKVDDDSSGYIHAWTNLKEFVD